MKIKLLFFVIGLAFGITVGWLIWGDGFGISLRCPNGGRPDKYGCCGAEVYTDLGENGWNCCPPGDGDCFPPVK